MSKYSISGITEFISFDEKGTYLVVINVNSIPPHIGLVTQGKYYSKSSHGGKSDYDFSKILNSLNRKKIPTLLIKLNLELGNVKSHFNNSPLQLNDSCLNPIKSMLTNNGVELKGAEFLFDVVKALKEQDKIVSAEHINCSSELDGNTISLSKYSQVDINNAIINARSLC